MTSPPATAPSPAVIDANAQLDALKKEFAAASPNLARCSQMLAALKLTLTRLSFLSPESATTQELLIAREVLEIGALHAIRSRDIPAFERYIAQLKTYYNDLSHKLPTSPRLHLFLGLDLLRLLSQNKISDFHTALELIEPDNLLSSPYIKHPLHVEQCLMEGSYNKVWSSRQNIPAPEYGFFVDILMETIRNEIASCSEKAYEFLPVADAVTLHYFKTKDEVLAFAKERGWTHKDNKIFFTQTNEALDQIPAHRIMKMALGYAKELEKIV